MSDGLLFIGFLAVWFLVAFQELWTPLFQKHSPLGSVA